MGALARIFVDPDTCQLDTQGNAIMPRYILFIQLELCDMSLKEWLKNHLGTHEQIWEIFKQTAEGLYHIHRRGLIHRDIKPANVLLNVRGDRITAKLGDLG